MIELNDSTQRFHSMETEESYGFKVMDNRGAQVARRQAPGSTHLPHHGGSNDSGCSLASAWTT